MFNNSGDTVALFTPDGTLVDHYDYANDPGIDVPIGRTPDVAGNFQILPSVSHGSPNSRPRPHDTPTPLPTDKPALTQKSIITPKPVKNVTSLDSAINNKEVLLDATVVSDVRKNIVSPTITASMGTQHTAVFSKITKPTVKKATHFPNNKS